MRRYIRLEESHAFEVQVADKDVWIDKEKAVPSEEQVEDCITHYARPSADDTSACHSRSRRWYEDDLSITVNKRLLK